MLSVYSPFAKVTIRRLVIRKLATDEREKRKKSKEPNKITKRAKKDEEDGRNKERVARSLVPVTIPRPPLYQKFPMQISDGMMVDENEV